MKLKATAVRDPQVGRLLSKRDVAQDAPAAAESGAAEAARSGNRAIANLPSQAERRMH